MDTGTAILLGIIVLAAVGGFIAYQSIQARQQRREVDPAERIAGGAANLLTGIIEAATQ